MSRYTVVWHQAARDELAELWLASDDRQAITVAANAIDSQLAVDPETKGRGLEGDLRELGAAPLRVEFAVSELDRQVKVLQIALV